MKIMEKFRLRYEAPCTRQRCVAVQLMVSGSGIITPENKIEDVKITGTFDADMSFGEGVSMNNESYFETHSTWEE